MITYFDTTSSRRSGHGRNRRATIYRTGSIFSSEGMTTPRYLLRRSRDQHF